MEKCMDMEFKLGKMDNIIRVNIGKIENMDTGNSSKLMVQFIEAHSRKIKCMVKVKLNI